MKNNFKPNKKVLARERHTDADGKVMNVLYLGDVASCDVPNARKIEPIGHVTERTCRRWRKEDGLGKGEFY